MGHVILTHLIDNARLSDRIMVSSSGTGDWHVGEPADPRTVAVLEAHGYDGSAHRARVFTAARFEDADLVLASDSGHVRHLRRLARTPEHQAKIRLVREFDPAAVAAGTLETDDPWFGDEEGFLRCFAEVEAACKGILEHVRGRLEMEQG
jgi:protein-tyrosine phosphatase